MPKLAMVISNLTPDQHSNRSCVFTSISLVPPPHCQLSSYPFINTMYTTDCKHLACCMRCHTLFWPRVRTQRDKEAVYLSVKARHQGQLLACHHVHLTAQPGKHSRKLHAYVAATNQRHHLGQRIQLQHLQNTTCCSCWCCPQVMRTPCLCSRHRQASPLWQRIQLQHQHAHIQYIAIHYSSPTTCLRH
jgi:hypothetical protein